MQSETCRRPTRKLQYGSNDRGGATIRKFSAMGRTTARAIRLRNARQAGKRRRDAPESEADSTGLLREWNPGPLAPGENNIAKQTGRWLRA